tara:strand:+ start:32 stop:601 length:570 start_codon:yes stop_codon:yes gene_type:complete
MENSNNIDPVKISNFLKNIPVPEKNPEIPSELKFKIEKLAGEEIPNLSILFENIELVWLLSSDNRLGVTTFSGDYNEIFRKKRLNLPLGDIKIGLHPILIDDEKLYNHTLVHEILHASGMFEHSPRHDQLTNEIAPSPSFSESSVLRYLQAIVISTTDVLSWECKNCNFIWTRNTFIRPKKCPKCSSFL